MSVWIRLKKVIICLDFIIPSFLSITAVGVTAIGHFQSCSPSGKDSLLQR